MEYYAKYTNMSNMIKFEVEGRSTDYSLPVLPDIYAFNYLGFVLGIVLIFSILNCFIAKLMGLKNRQCGIVFFTNLLVKIVLFSLILTRHGEIFFGMLKDTGDIFEAIKCFQLSFNNAILLIIVPIFIEVEGLIYSNLIKTEKCKSIKLSIVCNLVSILIITLISFVIAALF